jgi:hypothetical protein
MAVFRDVSIPFGGRDYVVTPANKLLRMIEAKGRRDDPSFNLVAVFYRAASGAGAVNELAFVLAELINSAGGKTTEDGALAELMAFQDPAEFRAYVDLICGCVMPEVKETKKPEADGAAAMAAK